MILVDTSGLVAALFPDQRQHTRCAEVLLSKKGPLLSPFVIAETDHLLAKLGGTDIEIAFLAELQRGAYELPHFGSEEIGQAKEIVTRYQDQGIGLTDASLVVLSRHYRTVDILTLDERHFRLLTGYRNRPFRILPADLPP